ncbi:MAG TPA: hypothetical protein DIW44_02120 [Anaerolineaceae bacterium]|nr:hypothetical protein [Anaerolineaceae bacterium]
MFIKFRCARHLSVRVALIGAHMPQVHRGGAFIRVHMPQVHRGGAFIGVHGAPYNYNGISKVK